MKITHEGFTLIEVMVALTILAITFMIVLSFESNLMTSTKRSSNRIEHAWAMTNFLYECQSKTDELVQESNKKFTKKIEQPELSLTYEQKPINKDSDLKDLENIMVETVNAAWKNSQGATINDRIINVRLVIQEKEKKNKEQDQ